VFTRIRNYVVENPNAFQIVSTFVIGTVAFLIWDSRPKRRRDSEFDICAKTCLSRASRHPESPLSLAAAKKRGFPVQ
jgi:hypothetical protein